MDSFLKKVGFAVCHQLPGHTLSCGGALMPLCARCTGIYTGLLLTVLILLALGRLRRRRLPSLPGILLGLVFLGAMAVDVVTSLLGWRETNNAFRLATGTLAGIAIPVFGLPLANQFVWEGKDGARILGSSELLLISIVVLCVSFAGELQNPILFKGVSYASIGGLILFMLGMNALPLAGLQGVGSKMGIVIGAFILTLVELVLLANLHRWLLRIQDF